MLCSASGVAFASSSYHDSLEQNVPVLRLLRMGALSFTHPIKEVVSGADDPLSFSCTLPRALTLQHTHSIDLV